MLAQMAAGAEAAVAQAVWAVLAQQLPDRLGPLEGPAAAEEPQEQRVLPGHGAQVVAVARQELLAVAPLAVLAVKASFLFYTPLLWLHTTRAASSRSFRNVVLQV